MAYTEHEKNQADTFSNLTKTRTTSPDIDIHISRKVKSGKPKDYSHSIYFYFILIKKGKHTKLKTPFVIHSIFVQTI